MSKLKQYGLIGFPLGHSFSKGFFTEKFEREGIAAHFSNFEFEDINALNQLLNKESNLEGFNVTIPHKQAIIPFLSAISNEAREIGAVNVVKVTRDSNGKVSLKGFNSDVVGFSNSIKPLIDPSIHRKALVLGTGGASKAVVYGLQKLGLETQLVSRSKTDNCIGYDEVHKVLTKYKVIINCTPLGTFPNVENAPQLPYELLDSDSLLYDLVYNPSETEFLKRGKARGAKTKNGAEMLELQAVEAWRIWNEKE